MNKIDELPKGADDALAEGGYEVGEASAARELEMLTEAAAKAAEGPDGKNNIDALLAPIKELPENFEDSALAARLHALEAVVPGLSPLDRGILEGALHRALDSLGVKKIAKIIAPIFKKSEVKTKDDGNGQRLTFDSTDEHEEEVDGQAVADLVEGILRKYLVMPDGSIEATTLWIFHTYAINALYITPRLALMSPMKRCGKSTALFLLEALVEKPLLSYQPTSATLFRAMEKFRPTIILDEADTWIKDNEEIRSIVNGGFQVSGGVMRCSGDDNDVRIFNAYGAMAIAGIGELPSTIQDRSIVVGMRRKRKDEAVAKLRLDRIGVETEEVKRKIARWVSDNIDGIRLADPYFAPSLRLDDRAEDCWRPLFAIADLLGGDWPQKARDAAMVLSGKNEGQDEGELGTLLLLDIRDIFDALDVDRIHSKALVQELLDIEEHPWRELGKRGQGLSSNILGRMLSPFGIVSRSIRLTDHFGNSESKKGYHRYQFEESWNRYIPDRAPVQNVTTSQPNKDKGSSADPKRHKDPGVTFSNEPRSLKPSRCDVVTFSEGGEAALKEPEPESQLALDDAGNDQEADNEGNRRAV